jgi:hypothetical protein
MQPTNDPHVALIEIASDLANAGMGSAISGREAIWLERFRAAYWHMANTHDLQPGNRGGKPNSDPDLSIFDQKG